MIAPIDVNKPEPLAISESPRVFNRRTKVSATINALEQGKWVWVNEFYNDGVFLLKELHKHLDQKLPNKSFAEQQAYRSEYHRLSNLILLEVVEHKLGEKISYNRVVEENIYRHNSRLFVFS